MLLRNQIADTELCSVDAIAVGLLRRNIRVLRKRYVYLRIAQKYAIATHPMIVAEYRRHSQNVFSDFKRIYVWGCVVLFLTAMLRELPQKTPLHSQLSGTDEQIARRISRGALGLRVENSERPYGLWLKPRGCRPHLTLRLVLNSLRRRIGKTLPKTLPRSHTNSTLSAPGNSSQRHDGRDQI